MATIDELFDTMESDAIYTDVNDIIHIDPVSRRLYIPNTEIILGVAGDKRGERKFFCCPGIVGNGITVNACSLHIKYVTADGESGRFNVSDIREQDDSVLFSWELSEKVTRKAGDVQFTVMICLESNDAVVNEWSTTPAIGKVLPGLDATDADDDQDSGNTVISSEYLYRFNQNVLGFESNVGLPEMILAAFEDVNSALSAPWKLISAYNVILDSVDLWSQGLSLHGSRTGLDAQHFIIMHIKIGCDGIYTPSLTYHSSVTGAAVRTYLTKLSDSDYDELYLMLDDVQNSATIRTNLLERISNVSSSESLGIVDTYSTEERVNVHVFDGVTVSAGDYLLMFVVNDSDINSKVQVSYDVLDISEFSLKTISQRPSDIHNSLKLQQHVDDKNSPHNIADVLAETKAYIEETILGGAW